MTDGSLLRWTDASGVEHAMRWRAATGVAPPKRAVPVTDQITADAAYRLACEGVALIWQGDFQNARQLLRALARRSERLPPKPAATLRDAFNGYRLAKVQRARILGMLLIPLGADYTIPLRRAPEVACACAEVYGPASEHSLVSLRELLGVIGAHEWRKKGVEIPALGARIHPHYGVFSPVRGEYLTLVARAPLPASHALAFDIGTGTGVLAALLAARGVARVVATDQDPRALACATENMSRLGLGERVEIIQADLFPPGRAPLIVCNPPWVPGRPGSALEHAVYDPDSRMLRGFLAGLAQHLDAGGEGWLVLSDFAEHLGLRARAQLLAAIETAGLIVLGRDEIKPVHPKASDPADPLHRARTLEMTSLWRLAVRP